MGLIGSYSLAVQWGSRTTGLSYIVPLDLGGVRIMHYFTIYLRYNTVFPCSLFEMSLKAETNVLTHYVKRKA